MRIFLYPVPCIPGTLYPVPCTLSQVRERCPPLVRECHSLLPLLEEMEKHTAAFYLSQERVGLLTATARAPDGLSQNKTAWQVGPAPNAAVRHALNQRHPTFKVCRRLTLKMRSSLHFLHFMSAPHVLPESLHLSI